MATPSRASRSSRRCARPGSVIRADSVTSIEPNHRPPLHTPDHDPRLGGTPDLSNSQHPGNNVVPNEQYDGYNEGTDTDFQRAEALIATVYEALRDRPELFERCLLLVTYDEHGGLYDHVPPPRTCLLYTSPSPRDGL